MKTYVTCIGIFAAAALPIHVLGAAPTFTLGPASNYHKTPATTASPTGGALAITPTDVSKGIPAAGIDFFFGPDLQQNLSKALSSHCNKDLTNDCANGLIAALDAQHSYAIEARVAGVETLVPAALGVLIAVLIQKFGADTEQSKIQPLHLESSDIAQLQSQTESTVMFVTASDTAVAPITITMTTTTSVAPNPASVTTLSADGNGHHKGDLLISLPTEPAQLLRQVINVVGGADKCKNLPEKRSGEGGTPNYAAINDMAAFVLPMAAPGQLLDGLGMQAAQQLPRLQDTVAQASLAATQAAAAGLAAFQGLPSGLVSAIAEVVWIAVYDVCVNAVDQLEQLILEDTFITDEPSADDSDNKNCAPKRIDAPDCEDPACSGKDEICQQGDHKGCVCLEAVMPYWLPSDFSDWEDSQKYLAELLGDESAELPVCDTEHRIDLETASFKALSESFCKDLDLSRDSSKDVTPADAGFKGYDGYKFSFKWEKADGTCSTYCADIFTGVTKTTACSQDSHTVSASGSIKVPCGTASFSFSKEQPKPDNTPQSTTIGVNLGNFDCGKDSDMGNPNHYVDLETLNQEANFFCDQQVKAKTRFEPGRVADDKKFLDLHYNNKVNDPVYLSMEWIDNAGCPVTNFGADGFLDVCKDRLGTAINNCDTRNDQGFYYWKQGGTFFRDCVSWAIRRDAFTTAPPTEDSWRPLPIRCAKDKDCDNWTNCLQVGKGLCNLDKKTSDQGWCGCKDAVFGIGR